MKILSLPSFADPLFPSMVEAALEASGVVSEELTLMIKAHEQTLNPNAQRELRELIQDRVPTQALAYLQTGWLAPSKLFKREVLPVVAISSAQSEMRVGNLQMTSPSKPRIVEGAMLLKGTEGGGGSSEVNDEDLTQALFRHHGNRTKAGEELGLTWDEITFRLEQAKEGSYLWSVKGTIPSDERAVAIALKKYRGDIDEVAKKFEKTRQAVLHRIRYAKPNSPLWEFREIAKPKREVHHKPRVDDITLAAALEKYGGHRTAAADEFNYSPEMVGIRIKRATPTSPLAKFKNFKKIRDIDLAVALERHGGNIIRAANEVDLKPETVLKRILSAKPKSPLAKFKSS
ncbi:MAG: hypothetical protein A2W61_06565 [Deltaproteobacteria bacterium RIFCSPLOWO2_01_44_7]|nr:MAG: hypothetical protein A2712_10710 [Deltaproteobacteria bacterium RIFCSPHIGHO2_01_FULL_43_49]OGQ16525.1 MAG: hypothetical protein A3D22_06410 [Deltaproteobacteria bacterium RIFCSPHIGHO2_02_FULL_44_53]OGQ28342.1 MAG: hypothetical protein A3D98_06115 [Deltaproteobacteria bacterium RIFCSPHIGHO2_12_FULL_44_21]OGQ32413.1 MAG: hypothetical protein A2979_10675 [Deltaproteobacteria bacterium RIFCSPLOWO2_01_FULL_45_74]OGQ38440.1 MAG: hypothetical protein A2W61_06565 [Deltaproteobacteria bacterium 